MLTALGIAGCSTPRGREPSVDLEAGLGQPVVIYVIKRRWHTDIGFNAASLPVPLTAARLKLPAAHYLLFGFGDRHYLVTKGRSVSGLLGALWPGQGVVLVTGLADTPEQAFGEDEVIRLTLHSGQARRLEAFIGSTLVAPGGVATLLAPGPYADSYYYAASAQYSGLNTCNTWTAAALQSSGLPVHSFGVEFSGQVWRQVRRLSHSQTAGP